MQKHKEITETMTNGYSSESTQWELIIHEYQYDRVSMVFKNLCILMLWKKCSLSNEKVGIYYNGYVTHLTMQKPFYINSPVQLNENNLNHYAVGG